MSSEKEQLKAASSGQVLSHFAEKHPEYPTDG